VLAENSAPGDTLYSLKLGVEEARLLANGDPAQEVQLHLEFATKRLWELRPLFAEERLGFVGKVTENLRRHTASTLAGLDEVRGTIRGEALRNQVETVLSRQVESLADLFEGSCGDVTDTGPAGRLAGGPANACQDLGRAFRDSARALAGVSPMEPIGHQAGGGGEGQRANVRAEGKRGVIRPARRQKGKGKASHRKHRNDRQERTRSEANEPGPGGTPGGPSGHANPRGQSEAQTGRGGPSGAGRRNN
jgi:Domain of unknown function (DUF5667)